MMMMMMMMMGHGTPVRWFIMLVVIRKLGTQCCIAGGTFSHASTCCVCWTSWPSGSTRARWYWL